MQPFSVFLSLLKMLAIFVNGLPLLLYLGFAPRDSALRGLPMEFDLLGSRPLGLDIIRHIF